jgi:nicotinamide-nucleotide amidase
MITASIITIGDELLIGQVIDTNSAWMAQQLNKTGIKVSRRIAIGDNGNAIWQALDEEFGNADIILITGGLGPTADDITKPVLCDYFGGKLITDKEVLDHIKLLFQTYYKRPLTERNIKQAEVPDNCTVLFNKNGTAPGMLFRKKGKLFFSLPGVPHEMKGLMEEKVLPILKNEFSNEHFIHRTLVTFGVGESTLADMIQDFENQLPNHIKLAYLPNYGIVRLRLSGNGIHQETLEAELTHHFNVLQTLVKDFLVTNIDESMEAVIGKLLMQSNKKIATAESCTGGYIAHLLSAIPGASAYYEGSIISYSYEAKENLLGVEHNTLIQYGAVSEEVVKEMVKGILNKMKTDYAIAVSGIMGPDGGQPDKPVGTVWVAVGDHNNTMTKKFHFRFDRNKNIELTVVNALNLLRIFINDTIQK